MNKPFPKMTTDHELETILDSDLSAYLNKKILNHSSLSDRQRPHALRCACLKLYWIP
jgi:predicted DNA binding CopG/RHH family protein